MYKRTLSIFALALLLGSPIKSNLPGVDSLIVPPRPRPIGPIKQPICLHDSTACPPIISPFASPQAQ